MICSVEFKRTIILELGTLGHILVTVLLTFWILLPRFSVLDLFTQRLDLIRVVCLNLESQS